MSDLLPLIERLRAQGYANNEIVSQLQQQGYASSQIFEALSPSRGGAPSLNTQGPAYQMMEPQIPLAAPMRAPQMVQSDSEELIEAIIDEKWNDLMGDINKVIAWKDATETRIAKMEQQVSDLKEQFSKLQAAVIAKVGEYDQHVLDVGAEVKAMEKVFSKVLPVFTDNVAELSRVTERMRKVAPAVKK